MSSSFIDVGIQLLSINSSAVQSVLQVSPDLKASPFEHIQILKSNFEVKIKI